MNMNLAITCLATLQGYAVPSSGATDQQRMRSRTPRFTCAGATDAVSSHRPPLPGVRCKRLLGPDLGTAPGPSPPWPLPWHPPRSRDAGERVGPVGAGGLGWARSSPSLVLNRLCLGLSCLGGSLSWGFSVLDGPCHAVVVPPLVSWEFVFRPQGLTPRFRRRQ